MGWLKLHVEVDTRCGEVLSMEVTEEDIHDSRMLKPLIDGSLKVAPVGKSLGDGAYDSRANYQFLSSNGIEPLIRVRKNSVPKAGSCYPRKLLSQEVRGAGANSG